MREYKLAAVHYARGCDIDKLLIDVCGELARGGLRIGGLLQWSSGDKGRCARSVQVVDIRSRQAFDIWQERGASARGCRLDERGLVEAEPSIRTAIAERVDLLVINRYGRAESQGRGLRNCIESAIELGIPVLTAVRQPYIEDWRAFHGGLGIELPCIADGVVAWALRTRCSRSFGHAARNT